MGLPIVFAIIGGNPAQFKLIDGYKEVYEKAGHNQEEMKIGVHSHTFIADSASSVWTHIIHFMHVP
jgi:alkanesulfonate monooxygenase SsuD/methylene tetrahydromethanopterin reductase-like flavin-dependent oxidoreductase (luciferase family)